MLFGFLHRRTNRHGPHHLSELLAGFLFPRGKPFAVHLYGVRPVTSRAVLCLKLVSDIRSALCFYMKIPEGEHEPFVA